MDRLERRRIWREMPFLELFTLLMTGWAVYMYAVSFVLQLSGQMIAVQTLRLVIFGPAVILLSALALYELAVRHRRLGRALVTVAVICVAVSACAGVPADGSSSVCQPLNSYCFAGRLNP